MEVNPQKEIRSERKHCVLNLYNRIALHNDNCLEKMVPEILKLSFDKFS